MPEKSSKFGVSAIFDTGSTSAPSKMAPTYSHQAKNSVSSPSPQRHLGNIGLVDDGRGRATYDRVGEVGMTDFFPFAQRIANCPHRACCRRECGIMPNDRPSPDYVGPRYRGLVVIGANPGIASTDSQRVNDARTFELQTKIAEGNRDAFSELLRFLPMSMMGWKQVVDRGGRDYLGYDIEEIAYINIVKCATSKPLSDVFKLFTEGASDIPRRCWETHTQPILEALRPRFVVALWLPVIDSLKALGYQFAGVRQAGSYNGQRNLPKAKKYQGAKRVFDSFSRHEESSH
jgi:hypothetical protein